MIPQGGGGVTHVRLPQDPLFDYHGS